MIRRFFEELKRRRVIPVVTWYVLAVWVLLQVADVLGPVLTGGDQVLRFIVWLAVLGFPLALFLGWRYDFSGGNIERTPPAGADERTPLGRRDYALLGIMAVAALALGAFAVRQAGEQPVVEAIGAPNSVAVLRIEDRTGGRADLAETLSEGLVTTLIANDDLRVSGRASSFYFSDHPAELPRIAQMLEARYLLAGTLSGDAATPSLRFELLTMPTGEVAWADNLEVDPERPWQLYAPVADDIAQALGVARGSTATVASTNPELENLLRLADQANDASSLTWLDQAAALAPDDPRPWVEMSFAHQDLLMFNAVDRDDAMLASREALDRARELGADSYRYHWAEGRHMRRVMRFEGVTPEREKAFNDAMDRAIALNPSDAVPFVSYAIHHRLQRRYDVAGALLQRSLERDPLYAGARMQYARILSAQGQKEEALRWVRQLPPLFGRYWFDVVYLHIQFSEFDQALWWLWRTPGKSSTDRYYEATTWAEVHAFDEARTVLETLVDDDRVGLDARMILASWDPEQGPAAALAMALAALDEALPDERQYEELERAIRAAVAAGEDALVVSLIERRHPQLIDPVAPEVTERNVYAALALASALRRQGLEPVREGVLASQVLALGRNRPVLGFDGIGDRDIRVYAYRGETERALALLEQAVEEGFLYLYGSAGELAPEYGPLLDEPRFQALKARIDEDLAAMADRARQWIADGTDLMGPPPTELAQLSPTRAPTP